MSLSSLKTQLCGAWKWWGIVPLEKNALIENIYMHYLCLHTWTCIFSAVQLVMSFMCYPSYCSWCHHHNNYDHQIIFSTKRNHAMMLGVYLKAVMVTCTFFLCSICNWTWRMAVIPPSPLLRRSTDISFMTGLLQFSEFIFGRLSVTSIAWFIRFSVFTEFSSVIYLSSRLTVQDPSGVSKHQVIFIPYVKT